MWLLPVVRETASVDPDPAERLRAVQKYGAQLDVDSVTSFALAPEMLGRAGAVAVAALLLVPLAGLAARRRWAAFVVGGSLAVLVLMLLPALFTPFADAVSLSQARRAAGFLPFAFAFAGGMGVLSALARACSRCRSRLPPGSRSSSLYPGDFDYVLTEGGPAWATWVALAGGVGALAWGFLRRPPLERAGGLAAALFLLPVARVRPLALVAVGGPPAQPADSRPRRGASRRSSRARSSTPTWRRATGSPPPPRSTSATPRTGHVADTEDNRPFERRDEAREFFRTGDLAIPRRCGAGWLVVDRSRFDDAPSGSVVYRDGRYTLYRLDRSG